MRKESQKMILSCRIYKHQILKLVNQHSNNAKSKEESFTKINHHEDQSQKTHSLRAQATTKIHAKNTPTHPKICTSPHQADHPAECSMAFHKNRAQNGPVQTSKQQTAPTILLFQCISRTIWKWFTEEASPNRCVKTATRSFL